LKKQLILCGGTDDPGQRRWMRSIVQDWAFYLKQNKTKKPLFQERSHTFLLKLLNQEWGCGTRGRKVLVIQEALDSMVCWRENIFNSW
jgi:hypothetical protein